MISVCPFCGKKLDMAILNEGITQCQNCLRLFDSSKIHAILSVGWANRRGYTVEDCGLNEEERQFVSEHYDKNPDVFFKLVREKFLQK